MTPTRGHVADGLSGRSGRTIGRSGATAARFSATSASCVGTVETARVNEALDWADITATAVTAFLEDNGDAALSWGQLHEYVEKYMKPVFVARACDLEQLEESTKTLNYSALARRLNIADGSTVKMHLGRYMERFRTPRPKK